ncbi:MAG: acetyltransferase [Verrucomicrobia bacterium]|nr:acetyltransferase [Verrucomicrobiota bacterium]MBU1910342.1 acetyltransferase [Verrucomicrobiota bacterium]
MPSRNIVVLGAGYHAGVVIEAIQCLQRDRVIGILDDQPSKAGQVIGGVEVLGPMSLLDSLAREERADAVILGIGNIRLRKQAVALFRKAQSLGLKMVTVVHPAAFVSPSARLGAGCFVGPGVVIHTNTRLGDGVTIYSGSTVDHDNEVQEHVFMGPGVHTAGKVTVEAGAYIGPGAVIGSECRVGAGSIVGAGAVVLEDVPPGCLVAGVPARKLKSIAEWEQDKS